MINITKKILFNTLENGTMLNAQKKLHGSTYNSSRVRGNHICESLANASAGEISNSKSWFRFFRRKIQVQATYFGIYTYKIDSESLERIKLQWNAQTIRKRRNSTHEQIKLHYTSRLAEHMQTQLIYRWYRICRCIRICSICQHESQGKEEREEGRPRGNLRHDQRHSNSPIRSHTTQLTESITQNQSD